MLSLFPNNTNKNKILILCSKHLTPPGFVGTVGVHVFFKAHNDSLTECIKTCSHKFLTFSEHT